MTLATHCSLRSPLPIVTVLGFNYKTHMHYLTNWTILRLLRPTLPSSTKFQQKRVICGAVIDDSTHYLAQFLSEFCGQNSDITVRFSDPHFCCFHCSDRKCAIFYLRCIWPNDFEHVLHVALCTGMIFTHSKLGQPIHFPPDLLGGPTVFLGLFFIARNSHPRFSDMVGPNSGIFWKDREPSSARPQICVLDFRYIVSFSN